LEKEATPLKESKFLKPSACQLREVKTKKVLGSAKEPKKGSKQKEPKNPSRPQL
jgi:hypothetical protein